MMEFLMTMVVIAMVFCAATVIVAGVAGGMLKFQKFLARRQRQQIY